MEQKNKKKKGSGAAAVIVLLLGLLGNLAEGGVAAILTSSGQAASFYSIFNICEAGDHFISTSAIYGGTFNLFAVTFKKLGIEVTFVDQDAPEEEIQKAFRLRRQAPVVQRSAL